MTKRRRTAQEQVTTTAPDAHLDIEAKRTPAGLLSALLMPAGAFFRLARTPPVSETHLSLDPALQSLLASLHDVAPDAWLVGGAVRDLASGRTPVDLDIAVPSDARATADAIATKLGGTAFALDAERGVARVALEDASTVAYIDVSSFANGIEADLARRDFTIDAMARASAARRRARPRAQSPRRAVRPATSRRAHGRSLSADRRPVASAARRAPGGRARLRDRRRHVGRDAPPRTALGARGRRAPARRAHAHVRDAPRRRRGAADGCAGPARYRPAGAGAGPHHRPADVAPLLGRLQPLGRDAGGAGPDAGAAEPMGKPAKRKGDARW